MDVVQCFHCGRKIHSWKSSDIVQVEHFKHSPSCEAAKRKLLDVSYIVETLAELFRSMQELRETVSSFELKLVALEHDFASLQSAKLRDLTPPFTLDALSLDVCDDDD